MRSGTENVAGITGLGAAAEHVGQTMAERQTRFSALRDELYRLLVADLGDRVLLNGHPQRRLPNTLNVSITETVGTDLLAALPQLAASTGSACHDGSISSPVLAAMGLGADRVAGAIRLSLGRSTSQADIRLAADMLATAVRTVTNSS